MSDVVAEKGLRWAVEDVVDFEVYLERDEQRRREPGGEEALDERDREIFLRELQGPGGPGGDKVAARELVDTPAVRRRLFKRWLEVLRGHEAEPEARPGRLAASVLGHVSLVAVLGGLVLGLAVTQEVFAYGLGSARTLGDQTPLPVDVFFFLVVCVLPQFVFALGAALFLWRGMRGVSWSWPSLYAALGSLLKPLIRRAALRAMELAGAGQRERFQSLAGVVAGRKALHNKVLKWVLPLRVQWFGFVYGCTLFSAMVYLITFSDRSCGWYSSRWLTPERVHAIVQAISFQGMNPPSLEQIQGSQIRLSEGTRHLRDSDLKSWLGFLLWCVVVYGVVPRGLILGASYWSYRRALRRLDFQDSRCDRLFLRLTTPRVGWQAQPGDNSAPFLQSVLPPAAAAATAHRVILEGNCAFFAPPDLLEALDRGRLSGLIAHKRAWKPLFFEVGGGSAAQDREAVAGLGAVSWPGGLARVFFLQRAYMPPTANILRFIQECRSVCGPQAKMVVALVGLPKAGDVLTPAKLEHLQIWADRIDGLGDANCTVESLL